MIVPVVIGAVFGGAALISSFRKKPVPPYAVDEYTAAQRRVIYEAALNSKDGPALRKMAAAFRGEGCTIEADMLDKRAAICEVPKELQLQRREAFRKLMRCNDPVRVRAAAMTFDEMGCTGAAADLNRYASGLEDAARLEAEGLSHGDT